MIQRGLDEANQKMSEDAQGAALAEGFFATLYSTPSLQHLLSDPQFMQLVAQIRMNPSELFKHIQDPRVMEVFQVCIQNMQAGMNPGAQSAQPDVKPDVKPEPKPEPKSEPKSEPQPEPELSEEEKKALELKNEGNALYKQKQFDAALEKYNAVLALQPTNFRVRNNVCAVYLEQGKFAECVEYGKATIEIERENHASYEDVAKTYMRMGNAEMKAKHFDAALEFFTSSRTETPLKGIEDKIKEVKKLKEEADRLAYINPEEVRVRWVPDS